MEDTTFRSGNLLSRLDRIPITSRIITIIIMVTIIGLTEAFDIGIVGTVITVVKKLWHLNSGQLGLLGISSTLGVVLGLIPAGFLADKFGRRKIVILGITLFSLITFLGAFVNSFWMLLTIRFLAGIGEGAVLPIPYLVLSEFVRAKRRAVSVGFSNGFQTAAYLIPNLVGLWAVHTFQPVLSWRVMFGLGIIPLVLLVPLLIWLPESPRFLLKRGKFDSVQKLVEKLETQAGLPHDTTLINEGSLKALVRGEKRRISFSHILKPPYLGRGLIAVSQYLGGLILFYIMLVFGPSLFIDKGIGAGNALLITGLMMGFGGIGSIVQGYISDRYGRKSILFGYFFLAAIGCLMLMSGSSGLVVFGGLLTAFFGLGVYPVSKMYIAEQYPTRVRAEGVYMNEMSGRLLAGIVTTYFIPIILATWGNRVIFGGIAIAMVVLSLPMLLWGRETARLSMEEATTDINLNSTEIESATNLGILKGLDEGNNF